MKIYGNVTIPLASNSKWLKSMTVMLPSDEECVRRVAVINGVSCSNQPVINTIKFNQSNPYDEYALPGSYINITVPANFSSNKDPLNIWITESIEVWTKLFQQTNLGYPVTMHCGEKVERALCCPAGEHPNTSIHFPITTAGYYRSILTYSNDSKQVETKVVLQFSNIQLQCHTERIQTHYCLFHCPV